MFFKIQNDLLSCCKVMICIKVDSILLIGR